VREYYQILVDTLLGKMIEPYKKRQNRQVIGKAPKFYLFDVGVAGAISKRQLDEERGELFGKAFEHFILLEIMAYNAYHEVDFILGGGAVAIEVKGSDRVDSRDLFPLKSFLTENPAAKPIVVCNERTERLHEQIRIVPYRQFLIDLWDGNIIR
jgi:predicted AAA+ superfamily ATPase